MVQRWRRWWLVPLGYAVLTVLMTWPMATRLGTSLNSWGDPQLQTWILAWDAHALRTDPAAIWQAPIFYPYPDTLAYTDHHLVLSILAAPIIWLTANAVLAYNVLVLLSFVLSGWAMYGLTFELTRQRGVAFVAGAIFAFAPYRMAQIFHLQLLQTAWLIWALLYAQRLLMGVEQQPVTGTSLRVRGRRRDALLLGLFAGLQCVTALYYAFFTLVVLGGYVAWWLIGQFWQRLRHGVTLPWPIIGTLALSGLVAAAIVLPLTLPYGRVYNTLGVVRSVRELDNWSAPLRSYLTVTEHTLWARVGFAVNSGEWVLFPGLAATLLAGLALVWRPRGWVWFWALLAAGAFVLSLGTGLRVNRGDEPLTALPLYTLLYSRLPGFGALRVPSRWGMVVTLAFVVLAALALSRVLAIVKARWRGVATAVMLALVIIESISVPLRTTNPAALQTVAPIYPWLGDTAQRDIDVVLELPVGPTPRGDELQRITWRMFNSRYHWKRLPVAFSGIIPFGTTDLLAQVQHLPDDATLRYLQLVGVDTLVLHRNEYAPADLQQMLDGLAASPSVQHRADVGDASVYTLLPSAELARIETEPGVGSIWIAADERVPGMLALALARRWQDQGRAVYGAARLKYYGPLRSGQPGQVYDVGVLADGVDPRPFGYTAAGLRWRTNGLAFYTRDPALRANLDLAQRDAAHTHPTYPATLDIALQPDRIELDRSSLALDPSLTRPVIELDIASLVPQSINVGAATMPIGAGVTTVQLALPMGQTSITTPADTTALLRMRLFDGPPARSANDGIALQATSIWRDALLQIDVAAAGSGALLLDIQGAAALDDRPIQLVHDVQPLGAGPLRFSVDLNHQSAELVDGRYIAYLKSAAAPDAPGLPVATFSIRNNHISDQRSVPLPLTALP